VSEKLCVFCKHFDWEAIGYTYYSTLTGGDTHGGMSCRKGHFSQYDAGRPDDVDDFRTTILRAGTCPDYTPPEESK